MTVVNTLKTSNDIVKLEYISLNFDFPCSHYFCFLLSMFRFGSVVGSMMFYRWFSLVGGFRSY